jgi:hypothetical protein
MAVDGEALLKYALQVVELKKNVSRVMYGSA